MNEQTKIVAVICGALVFWYAMHAKDRRRELPQMPANTPSFTAAFEANPNHREAAYHAKRLSDICNEVANKIEYDAKRGDKARLTKDENIQDLRVQTRDFLEEGGSYSAAYPRLGVMLGEFFDARVGDRTENLTPERRAAWVQAFRDAGQSLLRTSEEL